MAHNTNQSAIAATTHWCNTLQLSHDIALMQQQYGGKQHRAKPRQPL
jgi:hypothetical protein